MSRRSSNETLDRTTCTQCRRGGTPVGGSRRRGRGALRLPDQLVRTGGARRVLSGTGRRHVPQVRARRRNPHGRTAGQRDAAAPRRQGRRRDGVRPADDRGCRAGSPARHDRRHVPEGSRRADRASRREAHRGSQVAHAADRPGERDDLLAVAPGALWIHRRAEAALRVQRPAIPCGSEGRPAGLRDVRALLHRERRRETERVPAG